MAVEFDHLFICTGAGASAAEQLVALGLAEGSANTHPGQGTANRRFFFYNAMLELLWVDDPAAAKSEPIQRSRLWERWANRHTACPFGICLRPAAGGAPTEHIPAFSSWDYRPPYLPQTISIAVGTNSDLLSEPMLFQLPFGQRPDQLPAEKTQPLDHPIGWREITRVELISPAATELSPELQAVINTDQLKLRVGVAHCVELGFDGETQGKQVDFRPELPLIVS